MAEETTDEQKKAFKALINEAMDEREAAKAKAAEEEAKKNPPAPKSLWGQLFGGN